MLRKLKYFFKNIFLSDIDNPNKVASAMSLGVFIAILPIYGLQSLIAVSLSHFLKLNKAIVFFATNISWPPMVFVLIYASYQTGFYLFNGSFNAAFSISENTDLIDNLGDSLYIFVVGSVIFGLVISSLTWVTTRGILFVVRKK